MAQFVKNIFKFMKNVVSPVPEDDCSTVTSKAKSKSAEKPIWTSQDKYLENKYKRVKIYNGETACTPPPAAVRNQNKYQPNTSCSTPKTKRHEIDDETDDSSEVESKVHRERCNQKVKRNRKRQKRQKRECRNEEENESSAETESDSVDRNASESPKGNVNEISEDGDSCDRLDKKIRDIVLTVRERCLKKKFAEIEQNAKALWNDCSTHLPQCSDCNVGNNQWKNLSCIQKLPFYWAAISGDFLKETPFENFLRFYLDEKGLDDKWVPNEEFKQHVQRLWQQMDENDKMPFVMESFMYRVSLGKVNMRSDRNIKDELDQILNRIG